MSGPVLTTARLSAGTDGYRVARILRVWRRDVADWTACITPEGEAEEVLLEEGTNGPGRGPQGVTFGGRSRHIVADRVTDALTATLSTGAGRVPALRLAFQSALRSGRWVRVAFLVANR